MSVWMMFSRICWVRVRSCCVTFASGTGWVAVLKSGGSSVRTWSGDAICGGPWSTRSACVKSLSFKCCMISVMSCLVRSCCSVCFARFVVVSGVSSSWSHWAQYMRFMRCRMVLVSVALPWPFFPARCLWALLSTIRGVARRSFQPQVASAVLPCSVCSLMCSQMCWRSWMYREWHCGGMCFAVGMYSRMTSQSIRWSPCSVGSFV